jgi:alginate O-acetyltransferase complex protein AlgI
MFNSIFFIFAFLPVALILYHVVPLASKSSRLMLQNAVLLVVSIAFFATVSTNYLPLLGITVLFNYAVALLIGRSLPPNGNERATRAKFLLAGGIAVNVALLLYYKYFGFFGTIFASFIPPSLSLGFEQISIVEPLGISFLMFSVISYLIDVYRKTVTANKNLLQVALWITFFPKIISGPIARYAPFEPALTGDASAHARSVPLDDIAWGTRRFVQGLAKKVIIADTLDIQTDLIFSMQPTGIDVPTAWLGMVLFTLQLFFDFAGYTDMAIGLAALFGFRLPENFNYPYIAHTIGNFWRRWHITLCTWLRDYLYIPLGGNRTGNVYVNLSIVFLISGLWHGASWHFIAWGMWHGFFNILDRIGTRYGFTQKIPRPLGIALTLLIVMCGWVIFRSSGMTQALSYLGMLVGVGTSSTQFFHFTYFLDLRTVALLLTGGLLCTPVFKVLAEKFENSGWLNLIRTLGTPLLLVVALIFLVNSTYSPFLYAQF